MTGAKWTGVDEAMRAIQALGEIAAPQVIATALRQVGQPMADEMAATCPRASGLTAEDFGIAIIEGDRADDVTLHVGAHGGKRGRSYVARFIERGTAHHPARPFMRPVWEGHRTHVSDDVAAALQPAYEKVVQRLARFARRRAKS